jgi:hypothetical protein
MLVAGGQIRLFAEVERKWAPLRLSISASPPGFRTWTLGIKSLRAVLLTTKFAGRWACPCPPRSTAVAVVTGRLMSVVDVSRAQPIVSRPEDDVRCQWREMEVAPHSQSLGRSCAVV